MLCDGAPYLNMCDSVERPVWSDKSRDVSF